MEWTAVSKKRRVGPPTKEPNQVSTDSRGENPCRKFVVELGDYRTEPEILAELHLRYPWVKLGRRSGMSGNAHLTARDERSRALLADLRSLNGKTCAFLPLESGTRRTFILMGVPKCITEKLLLQDEQVLVAERMTRWDATAKVAVPTDMVKVVLAGKQHPARFTRGYGSYRMRPFVKSPLQCFNCQRFGHTARTCWRDSQTCRYCAGSHPSSQCKGDKQVTLKCANYGEGHATTSRACSKRLTLVNKAKVAQKVDRPQAATPPTKNAWTKKFVPTMEDSTNFNCRKGTSHTDTYSGDCQATSSKTETRSYQDRSTRQRRQTPNVPRPVQRTVESQRCGVALKSPSPPQEEELEAITIALDGATALLRRVSTGKRHLIPALRKMIEAALDALKTLSA